MSWRETLRAHSRNAGTKVAEGARASIAAGRELAHDPQVRAAAGDFTADVVLTSLQRFAEAPDRPVGEARRARWRRRATVVFDAFQHVVDNRIDRALANAGSNEPRR